MIKERDSCRRKLNDRWVEQENIQTKYVENQNEKEIISIWFKFSIFLDTIKFFCNCNIRCFVARILFLVSLVFLEIYFLRPYAGGYHADTEIKCCMISVGIVNIAMLVRKSTWFRWIVCLLFIYASFV